jgi:hypothetical protein
MQRGTTIADVAGSGVDTTLIAVAAGAFYGGPRNVIEMLHTENWRAGPTSQLRAAGGPAWPGPPTVLLAAGMKPRAPDLTPAAQDPSLQTELDRVCEEKARERVTVPAPPSAEVLRAATPLPPEPPEPGTDSSSPAAVTLPAPPVVSQVVARGDHDEASAELEAAIPRPPRVPRIAGS